MLEPAVEKIARWCSRHAWLTLCGTLLLAALSGAYAANNFAITTDTGQLISKDLPWRKRELAFDAAFPQQSDSILVVVDGATPEAADLASKRLTDSLKSDTQHFKDVTRQGAGNFFERNGLLFLPQKEVQATADQVIRSQAVLGILAADPTLRGLAKALSLLPVGVQSGALRLEDQATQLSAIADAIKDVVANRTPRFSWTTMMSGAPPAPHELKRFISVKPYLDFGALQPGADASDAIRASVQRLGLDRLDGVRIRLTGPVPMADEEFATIEEGALLNGALTLAVLLVILWLALKSVRIIAAVLLTLAMGLAMTAAAGLAMVGALNLISVAFAVLFVGIGIDFGIQFAVRYREERHNHDDLQGALDAAARLAGKPLALAGAATAAGFFSFLPTDYQGVSELGQIAGVGMLIAFALSITVLPALLKILRPRGERLEIGYRALLPVDRFMARFRWPILAITFLAVGAGLPLLQHLKFDFNPLNLRSASVESVATVLELMKDPNTSPDTIEILAPSITAARELADKLEQLPEVEHAMTLESFVPADQDKKRAIIADAAGIVLPTLSPGDPPESLEDAEASAKLREAADAYAQLSLTNETAKEVAAKMADALKHLADAPQNARTRAQTALLDSFNLRLAQLRNLLSPEEAVTLETLPTDLKRDWVAADGRARVNVAPKGDAQDNAVMRKFVAAVLSVAPEATGSPVLIQESANTVVGAFTRAAIFALASITLILLIVLRRPVDVLVTLVPLIMASIVTLELMVLTGLPLNFANIIALPLLLGVGVAFKIYYVLAWRGGETNLLSSALTRAVMYSAMTTATAFGSLWFSHHPGTSSMGKLLALALLTTLCAAVLFQPILMGPPREKAGGDV